MKSLRRSLMLTGASSLLVLVGLIVILVALHRTGLLNAWQFPFKPVGAFFMFGSLVCFTSALVLGRSQHVSASYPRSIAAKQRKRRRLLGFLAVLLLCINGPAYLMAYHMTHVHVPGTSGVGVPKPANTAKPSDRGLDYATHRIPISDSAWLEAWRVPTPAATSRGTVILFPGNLGTKGSQLISPAQTFTSLGYDCLLVDFQGVGGSSGNTVTIGMKEAKDVVRAIAYAQEIGLPSPTILYGVSMGSAAILRAIAVENITPSAVILELPFARMLNAIRSRLRYHHIPAFPTAELLLFWGSVQHGINGFAHNPVNFAKGVNCPTLVIHGEQDKWTTVAEVEALFDNLKGPKQLVISTDAGHHQLIGVDRPLWEAGVASLLGAL